MTAEFSDDVKGNVRKRAAFRCELCQNAPIEAFHHRKLRRHGDNSEENCLGLCAKCHHLIHNDRINWAYRHGLILKSWNDPTRTGAWLRCLSHCPLDHVA